VNAGKEEGMKTVLIGSNGQLGTDLVKALAGWPLARATHADFDVCDAAAARQFLTAAKPELVINTAAFHKLDDCETQPHKAFAVNATAVRDLAGICRDLGATLVHISTDYVYGGEQSTPYTEEDLPSPVNVYGVSKLAGELLVRATCPRHYIIRTCGLYGVAGASGKGGNFPELMIRLAREGKPIKVVRDQVLTPSSTRDVAAKIHELVQTGRYGVYHVTNSGSCSWYEFAGQIFHLLNLRPDFTSTTTAAFAAATQRPAYSVLAKDGLRRAGLAAMRPWQEALVDYLRKKGHLTAVAA
jgi:dTDP-4-dehydrorhamnose reductase